MYKLEAIDSFPCTAGAWEGVGATANFFTSHNKNASIVLSIKPGYVSRSDEEGVSTSSLYLTMDWKNAKTHNRSEDCVTIAEIREHQLCKPLAEVDLFDLTLSIDEPAGKAILIEHSKLTNAQNTSDGTQTNDQNADSNSQVPPVLGENVEVADVV